MKYFEYICLAILVIFCVVYAVIFAINTRRKYLTNLSKINILKRHQKKGGTIFFSSVIIDECIKKLSQKNSTEAKKALAYLAGGRSQKAADYLQESHPMLALLLKAENNTNAVYKKMLREKKKWLSNPKYAVFLPILAYINFDLQNLTSLVAKINYKKLSRRAKPYYLYISAYSYLQEADMMSASKNASLALDIFKKKQMVFEEANCYLLLAEIYRISCVNDIAQTMIESAKNIYTQQKYNSFLAQTTAILGMLMLFENRTEEAESYYNEALDISPNNLTTAEILNQLALLFIAQHKYKEARKNAQKALELHTELKNNRGEALSLQLLGQIELEYKHYNKAAHFCENAAELYRKQQNFSALSECLYTAATALGKAKQYKKAEANLRQILDIDKQYANNFHIANAYSLLGLIYLKSKDYQRAKVLFQQSLHLEQRHERCNGLVADYANLALIEETNGDLASAQSNLEIALEYAQKTEDEDLINLIKNKLKPKD